MKSGYNYKENNRIFKIAGAVAASLLVIFLFMTFRTKPQPEEVVRSYINNLAYGDCKGAYKLVSSYAKSYFSIYGEYQKFEELVCKPVIDRYKILKVNSIETTSIEGDMTTIDCSLRFKMVLMPSIQIKSCKFDLRRTNGWWQIDGPQLEI